MSVIDQMRTERTAENRIIFNVMIRFSYRLAAATYRPGTNRSRNTLLKNYSRTKRTMTECSILIFSNSSVGAAVASAAMSITALLAIMILA